MKIYKTLFIILAMVLWMSPIHAQKTQDIQMDMTKITSITDTKKAYEKVHGVKMSDSLWEEKLEISLDNLLTWGKINNGPLTREEKESVMSLIKEMNAKAEQISKAGSK